MQTQLLNDEIHNQVEEENSIDIRYIVMILMRRWWIIATFAVVFGIFAGLVSVFYLKPIYSSSSSMFFYRKGGQENATLSEIYVGSQLVKDSVVLLKSDAVLSRAIAMTGAKMSTNRLAASISATVEKDTRILRVTVTNLNPEMAANLTNAVADSFLDVFNSLTRTNQQNDANTGEFINIIDKARVNKVPVKPNKRMNVMIALLLGMAVGGGIVYLIEFMDDTIKSPDVIKLQHNIDVIGVIPVFEQKQS